VCNGEDYLPRTYEVLRVRESCKSKNMKYFSTFSGIGGFELGIKQAYENTNVPISSRSKQGRVDNETICTVNDGKSVVTQQPHCVGYSEIDKYAQQIYQAHFPNHKNYADITAINEKELPDFDLLVGGFPCQSFSIAGKRGGFKDTRGTMFFELARIIKEKQPRLFVFENVKGLLSHDKGQTFLTIISTLDELGYDCQWQVLNSKNHGVPQNRERVFIIGHLRGTSRPEVFPFGDDSEATPIVSGQCSNTLTTRYYGGQANGTYVTESEQYAQKIVQLNDPKMARNRVCGDPGISPTLQTGAGGGPTPFIAAERGRYNKDGSISQKLEARKDDVSNTLTSVEKDNRVVNGGKIRRLTPTECERLQGFPVGWTGGVSDTQRYKTLGNAVTVNVIRDIMERIV